MFDVISLGSATLDVFVRSKGLEIERENGAKDICVRYGAKIPVDEIYFESGGGGTNTAVTFSRQGLRAASVVKLADDFSGKKIKDDLMTEGVECRFLAIEKGGLTDYSTVLWAPDGGRTILVYRGRTWLESADIPWRELETNWFYLSSVEGNLEVVSNCLARAADEKAKVAWNPGGEELKQKNKVRHFLSQVTLLNLNKEEMAELLDVDSLDINNLLRKCQDLPCDYLVVTDDRNGSYLRRKGEDFWWHCGIFEDMPRFETTGAGDSFGSGLVSALIKNFSLTDCLKMATANASSVVSQVGAKKGILTTEAVKNWLDKKIPIERLKL